jgi:ankyrin repeat protein
MEPKKGFDFIVHKYFGDTNTGYSAQSVGNVFKTLESKTKILGGYCFFETP